MFSKKNMSSNISHPLETLQQIEKKNISSNISHLLEALQQIEKECSPLIVCSGDDFHVCLIINSKLSHLRETLRTLERQCDSFELLLDDHRFPEESDTLDTQLQIREEYDSLRILLDTRRYSSRNAYDSLNSHLERYLSSVEELEFLKRDYKFLDIILNSQIFIDEPDVRGEVQVLFQGAAADFVQRHPNQVRSWHTCTVDVQNKFGETKLKIRSKYSIPKISFQLLANKDGIVVPNLVMEFIDTVTENLSDLLKFNDPSSLLCVRGLMVQIEKALKELKVLRSFVYFISCRCIEPQGQQTFFSHALEVAWHTIMVTWLYFRSDKSESAPDEEYPLFSHVLQSKIQPIEPSICKIFIDVLQALKLVESRWYPIIRIKHVIDCEVGFTEIFLHHLEEIPISRNGAAIKPSLQEMLNFLRTSLINLPTKLLEDIDSVIIDAGLLVYSLIGNKHEKEVTALGETNQALIQSMKEIIYFITRKSFLLRPNSPRIDGLGSTGFILDNLQEFIGCHIDSASSTKSQLQTIQKEIKRFQEVVEQRDGLQHFATRVRDLAYEVEYIIDACKEEVPDWCLSLWIFHIVENINLLKEEVEGMREMKVSDQVLHNTTEAARAGTPQFASSPSRNEEMVGFKEVMDELRGKLCKGSSDLDVISIVGMPGLGKTTLAKNLYFDESVVSHFDIRIQCCVSQEYTRKDLLLAFLRDITVETAELRTVDETTLAEKLRTHLMRWRYLVLIDDIWETRAWDDLKLSFPQDNNGSRIIMTTRHYEVASYAKQPNTSDPHKLRFFNTDESQVLLWNKVFNNGSCPSALTDVGKTITQKCGGLPLSIVLVAGILKGKVEKLEWEDVAKNLGTNIQAQSERTLDLSYQILPHYLKPCFLYLGVFPEDREIQVSKVTWLWIAEGFIETHAKKLSEDLATNYLENLIGRNLVMVAKKSSDGKIKACRIHDLVLEFCRKKASSDNFLEKIEGCSDRGLDHSCTPKSNTSRRLSFYSRRDNPEKCCPSFSHVKSFQFREARNIAFSSINLASDTFHWFKFLRVLDLEFTIIESYPQELTLLRYLAFRTNKDILSLPANLWNLETLIVQGLGGRVSVSDTIWEMVKLRHLHIYHKASFTLDGGEELERPLKMDNLQTLSSAYFSCVENASKILAKTPNLQKLRCEVSNFDGQFLAFNSLTKLEMLKISSSSKLTLTNQLMLPSNLKKLTLSNFHVNLNEVATPSNLVVLKLVGIITSSDEWKVNGEQFRQLKSLKLENLSFSNWVVLNDAFPCLERLELKRCLHLKSFPSCFEETPSLKSVEIISCDEALATSARATKKAFNELSETPGFEVFTR